MHKQQHTTEGYNFTAVNSGHNDDWSLIHLKQQIGSGKKNCIMNIFLINLAQSCWKLNFPPCSFRELISRKLRV